MAEESLTRDAYERGALPVETSGWTKPQGVGPRYPRLAATIDADVVIVGAGLAGSSLALHLAEAGVKVVVLEARQPGWGASGRNAGHVLPMLKDLKVFEAFSDGGRRFLEAFRDHHTIPFDLAAKHGIDCDAVRSGYLHGMTGRRTFEKFLADSAWIEEMRMQKVISLGGAEMHAATGSSRYPYGVLYENGGRVNPYLFTNGMIAAAVRHGAIVHGDSEALSIERVGDRWTIRTRGGEVRADRAVFCTAAYPTGIVPEFTGSFYPLTAYAMTITSPANLDFIMPGGATFAQHPIDLNPLVRDRHGRLVLSSIPRAAASDAAESYFRVHIDWLHRTWPQTRDVKLELESYWTGRVAMRDREFPGVFEVQPGLFGLMYFNAWGNVMAPLMGKLFAEGLIRDAMAALPFPIERPEPVAFPQKQEMLIRRLLIPAARLAQKLHLI